MLYIFLERTTKVLPWILLDDKKGKTEIYRYYFRELDFLNWNNCT
jgi:hypothetical protein